MKNLCIVITLAVLSVLASCKGGSTAAFNEEDIELRYARLLTLKQGDGYIVAEVKDPWKEAPSNSPLQGEGRLLHRYILVPRDAEVPKNLPQGELVRTPLQKTIVYTSVHTGLIDELGGYDAIKGVCDKEYMYLDKIQADVASGKITDCGLGTNPDLEKIIDLNPDAILLSPFENAGSYGKLGKLGIPIIECADYMENSALGRAEWMRFYGLLLGKEKEAESLFRAVEDDYNATKALVGDIKDKPTVVTEKKYGSTWYVAGANSTVGGLLADAGADYIFSDEPASGSVPYSPEVVFDRAQQADVWMFKYNQAVDITSQQLAGEWGNYGKMKAFTTGNVYQCNLSLVPYYEEAPFHPNILLKEYVKILHPDVLKDYELRYYKKLK
ncbi:MAG: ABC transporter substrate-binding protein [Prevotella sp.]|nr:ABC transporter substrate-binding protein [Prevotella sp.]